MRSTVDTSGDGNDGPTPPPKYPKSVPCGATFSLTDDAGNNVVCGSPFAWALVAATPYLAALNGPFAAAVAVSLE